MKVCLGEFTIECFHFLYLLLLFLALAGICRCLGVVGSLIFRSLSLPAAIDRTMWGLSRSVLGMPVGRVGAVRTGYRQGTSAVIASRPFSAGLKQRNDGEFTVLRVRSGGRVQMEIEIEIDTDDHPSSTG